ncbi:5-guanidino-2-oxopentanoate decarboxylase [Halomonas piscis]|uniref:5-guanidino-2-oxopentanoate decarboxylase n=1 Tax=Halomonas piscis TaxID=3031727 RepID=UPI00289E9858|nr:5-guanidino-2-oxopentanoate decarboxylase [Halomonas piscis]
MTCAELLVRLLRDSYSVNTIFGIPGVHTVELYRSLKGGKTSGIRHITPRHEQGAGFMADGYARANGKPGVCWIISGPGITNITTAMAQALADSIPMLVISSVSRRDTLGRGQGRLHELPNQQQLLSGVSRFSHTLLDPSGLPELISRAFAIFHSARPGPVHIEIPIDIFNKTVETPSRSNSPLFTRCAPDSSGIAIAAEWLRQAKRPLVLLGGGCIEAPEAARHLIEALDAPTVTTINAKGLLGRHHPLDLGANASLPAVREVAHEADVVLAIGTELGETDYDSVFDEGFILTGKLIRIDIDAEQLARNQHAALAIMSDAGLALEALSLQFSENIDRQGAARTKAAHQALALDRDPAFACYVPFFDTLYRVLPDSIIVGDSCATTYAGNHLVSQPEPRRFFNASTGYGTLGYGLPAALGAQLAQPQLPVIALVGDGSLMFTLSELAVAVEERLPIIIILWHNQGYEEIRRFMNDNDIEQIGVDIQSPNFQVVATGFGCAAVQAHDPSSLEQAIASRPEKGPLLVEIDAAHWQRAIS